MIPNLTTSPPATRTRRRFLAVATAGSLALAACGGGSDDASSSGGDQADIDLPTDDGGDLDTDLDLDTGGLDIDTDGLDDGQIEILDDVVDGLNDEFNEEDDGAAAPWAGIRVVSSSGVARMETLDEDSFGGVTEVFTTTIPEPVGNNESANRAIDNSVIVDDSIWISGTTALHRVSLADGTITASVPIDDVLPGGSFGDITGDANGVYAVAAMPGGGTFVADVDPAAGTLRNTIDFTAPAIGLFTIASNDTHVAAAYDNAPGIPVQLIDRSSGAVTEIGNYLKLHEVHFVRDELWVVISSGKVSEPATYEKYALDGTLIGEGTLPRTGILRVFGDRAVMVEPSNAADPSAPVAPIEVEPVGTPIEAFLPDGMVLLSAYAEIDGYAYSSASCCMKDEFDFPSRTAVIDMATGDAVFAADSSTASAILPAADV